MKPEDRATPARLSDFDYVEYEANFFIKKTENAATATANEPKASY